ncbi:MAG TPA: NADP-dependent isocitrate dehydrogenase [Elusimicrobia bacterium]|nr:NADP-dependent isocitrate dehydrogenase [Elusimicrobiota bacterium]
MALGEKIRFEDGTLRVPDRPLIPFIEGDGTGPDLWAASRRVFDGAVEKAFGGRRRIEWLEVLAGEKAFRETKEWLPDATLKAMEDHVVSIKGPLGTPVGGGIRSLNVTIRQKLDLYACVRPVRYFEGTPSPMKDPGKLDVVIFRENTEDVYAGIEWPAGSPEALKLAAFLENELKQPVRADSGLGIKPVSRMASRRLVRMALQHALKRGKRRVTLVHKGNIMKFTEGAFREWGYELAREEFPDAVVTEADVEKLHGGRAPAGKVVLNDRIADSMFQQALLRPEDYEVLVTTNLNGDYLSDACAAQVGGLGMAPGANIGDRAACFEATHGTAPKYAGQDKVNPGSLILSGAMMLDYMGWVEAAASITKALEKTLSQKKVTYDLHRQLPGAQLLKCSEFASAILSNL